MRLLVGLCLLIFAGAGCVVGGDVGVDSDQGSVVSDQNVEEAGSLDPANEGVVESSPSTTAELDEAGLGTNEDEEVVESNELGVFVDYSVSVVEEALGQGDQTVLFFHATWCPFCVEAAEEFSTQGVPAGVTVVKTDFDIYKDLKAQYGVRFQHTFVLLAADGSVEKTWVGGGLDRLISELN